MKKIIKYLLLLIVVFFVSWVILQFKFEKAGENPFGSKKFTINVGESVTTIAHNLQDQGFLSDNVKWFTFYVRLQKVDNRFQAGEYNLNTQMSIKELVRELTENQRKRTSVPITIIEGWRLVDVADYLEEKGLFSSEDFLEYLQYARFDYDFLRDLPSGASLEGYLYPDTYYVYDDSTIDEVVRKMLDNFDKKLTLDLREEIKRQGKSIHEIVTLSSIVEKEMFGYENRRVVADIFWSRLDDKYPLQSDATVNYITQKGTTRPSLDDTKIDNPYNTYQNSGLPPGPICNPSIEAIKATVYPADTSYYFFLTTPTNEIIFSRNHEEHIINRNKYLK